MLRYIRRGTADTRQPIGDLPLWLSSILRNRGIDTPEKAERFLSPSVDQLHDPFLMEGMDRAVAILREAIAAGDAIQIYGDYDCDGVCATSIMLETLTEMGARVDYRIPSRHGEGYGLNCNAVREIARDHRVLLTVDCGVTNHQEVHLARQLGMKVIVSDHHQLADTPSPADVVLNPLCGNYPFRRLCGAGVALKLTQALLGMDAVMRRIDLAALATVADLVPLIDENRVIVRAGLDAMYDCRRPGLRAMMLLANVTPPVSSTQVAYRLAPRINAGGRLEDAAQCVALLTGTDEEAAQQIAQHLEHNNEQRQAMQAEITHAAENVLEANMDFFEDRAIIVMGTGWNSGVIGLAAGRICEKYHFPTIVLTEKEDGTAVGSCRSIPGVNIHAMLCTCQDLFIRFGGHEQAAGLTMRPDLVPELRRRLNLAIRENCDPACYIETREYDEELSLADVTLDLVERLETLQPSGYGNPAPVFLTRGAHVQQARAVGKTEEHLKLALLEGNALRDGIAFQMGALAREGMELVDVLYAPDRNEFRGKVTAQLQVNAIRPAEGSAPLPPTDRLFEALLQEITGLASNNEQIPQVPEAATPDRVHQLMQSGQGTLLIGHERERAAAFALEDMADAAVGQVRDRRGFSTVLCAPQMDALRDVWQHIVLLDGDVLPGEAAAIAARCPRAKLWALKPNPAFVQLLSGLALSRELLGKLYLFLRGRTDASAEQMAAETGLTHAQVLTGLIAFAEVGLAEFRLSPWTLRLASLMPGEKKNLDDSPLLRYLRSRT